MPGQRVPITLWQWTFDTAIGCTPMGVGVGPGSP